MQTQRTAADGVPRDARGYKRPASTMPGYHAGRTPSTKGKHFSRTPPTWQDILALLGECEDTPHGRRRAALVVFLARTGVRISEGLSVHEEDLTPPSATRLGQVFVRNGKGDRSRTVGMDPWAWEAIAPWLEERREYPPGPVFCVLTGPTAGRALDATQVRAELRRTAKRAGLRRRMNPHAYRHLLAVEWLREGTNLVAIKNQLGHKNLRNTDIYLSGIDPLEVLTVAAHRSAPVVPLSAALRMKT